MKYLLHSRKFKSVLFKWLFCYIGVMVLFTAVVTYSRYISELSANADEARAAKFNVVVSKICDTIQDESIEGDEGNCGSGSYRTKRNNEFYFTIDTTQLEVSAVLDVTVTVNENFTNAKIYAVDEIGEPELLPNENFSSLVFRETNNENQFSFTESISALSSGHIRLYKVTCDYVDFDINYATGGNFVPITVVYSATQKN